MNLCSVIAINAQAILHLQQGEYEEAHKALYAALAALSRFGKTAVKTNKSRPDDPLVSTMVTKHSEGRVVFSVPLDEETSTNHTIESFDRALQMSPSMLHKTPQCSEHVAFVEYLLTSIVTYNLGLLHQLKAKTTEAVAQSELARSALRFYDLSRASLSHFGNEDGFCFFLTQLPLVACTNNVAFLHSHYSADLRCADICCQDLALRLTGFSPHDASSCYIISNDEYQLLFGNAFLFDPTSLCTASAA